MNSIYSISFGGIPYLKVLLKNKFKGTKALHKTFWDTTKKCENKNLS